MSEEKLTLFKREQLTKLLLEINPELVIFERATYQSCPNYNGGFISLEDLFDLLSDENNSQKLTIYISKILPLIVFS